MSATKPKAGWCPGCKRREEPHFLSCIRCGARYTRRPCVVCGKRYKPTAGVQRFCSAVCREVVYPPSKDTNEKSCRICGETFKPRRAHQAICSTPCQRIYLRHRANSRIERKDEFLGVVLRDPCVYCGSQEVTGFDHITPKVQGGSDGWENLAPCCPSCNSSKSAAPLLLFLRRRPVRAAR